VEAGTRLGRLVVHDYLGQGCLGSDYRALDQDGTAVVVKVLHRLAAQESIGRFRETAPRLLALRHPNLVSVLGYGEHGGPRRVPYLVEEPLPGCTTLAERFRRASVAPAAAMPILRALAAAVDSAHRAGLVHGSVEPVQVLLCPGDRVVVADVGLAGLRRPRSDALAAGRPHGMPEYLAPEQARCGEPTVEGDRYAVAAIAYQLLVDRPPFEGEPQAVLDAHLRTDPPRPSLRNRALPVALDDVLARGLAKDPPARWPSCSAMVDALAAALGPQAGEVAGRPPRPPAPRVRWARAAAGAAVVLLAGAAAGLLAGHRSGTAAVTASTSSARPGEVVTLSVDHMPADQPGVVRLGSGTAAVASLHADRDGRASARLRIPDDTRPGDQVVSVCWQGTCPAAVRLTVVQPGIPPPATPAPSPIPSAAHARKDVRQPRARVSPRPAGPVSETASGSR